MKRPLKKWLLGAVSLGFLVMAALLVMPRFIDLNRYKAYLEKRLSTMTGYPVTLGGKIDLSLFPWVGFAFTDLHIGNPDGFAEKDFVSAEAIEMRVKLIPLLSGDLEVKRFVVDSPRIVLVKNRGGRGNWERLGRKSAPETPGIAEDRTTSTAAGLPIRSLAVQELAVRNGLLLWRDDKSSASSEISQLRVDMKSVSWNRPIYLDLAAHLDGHPLTVKGEVGPLGGEIGATPLPVDLAVTALEEISLRLKGTLSDPFGKPGFALTLHLDSFSPRRATQSLGREFPMRTRDGNALSRLSAQALIQGTPQSLAISQGILQVDDATINFSLNAKNFSKPDLSFRVDIDRLDADRYLPPAPEKRVNGKNSAPGAAGKSKTDYGSLRQPALNGTVKIGNLQIGDVKTEDIQWQMTASGGRYHLDPLTCKLYGGRLGGTLAADVRGNTPRWSVNLQARNIQAGPLLTTVLEKDNLEGTLQADAVLTMQGADTMEIKQTLNGRGNFNLSNGAIRGIDLTAMIANVKTAFGLIETIGGPKPRTEFSEMKVPFTMTNGRFTTTDAALVSSLLRVRAAGTADLVAETLDFRLEPTVVGTIKGQGDIEKRSGIMVPVLVSGTFSRPIFRPDLERRIQERLREALTDPEKFRESLKEEERALRSLRDQGKEILKGLRFGR